MATIRKLGSIYYEGAVANPGFTCYTPEPKIFFGDTVPGKELRWVVAGERLVGDRCACTNISWNSLSRQGFVMGWPVRIDGKPYMCRCPSVGADSNHPGEWDALIDEFGVEDFLWHWKDQSFWGQEAHPTIGGFSDSSGLLLGEISVRCRVQRPTSIVWVSACSDAPPPYSR